MVDTLNEDGMLRMWGRSYGTVLAHTFAAMFPDRIDRMVLDSIVRPEDYYGGTWMTAFRGTDIALENFFRECINAGPDVCHLANYSGPNTTPQDLMLAYAGVFQELINDPVILPATYPILSQPWWQLGNLPLYQELKYWTLVYLYRPVQFYTLLSIIGPALARNWTSYFDLTAADLPRPSPQWNLGVNNFAGIACSDSRFRASSPDEMYSLVEAQAASGSFSDAFAPQIWPCAQWKFDAAERFNGSFYGINTSYPLLFVNGAYDPITPLSAAQEAATGFLRSGFLEHRGHGHGLFNHPSTCVFDALRAYFSNGTLPVAGTVCQPDQTGFEIAVEYLTKLSVNSTDGTSD